MQTSILLGALTFSVTGCLVELDTIQGYMWCAEAVGANGSRAAAPHGNVNITRSGDWVTGCRVYCPSQQDIMVAGENGEYDEEHPLYASWQALRGYAITNAVAACENRVDQLDDAGALVFTYPGDITCADAVALADNVFAGPDGNIPPEWCEGVGDETGIATDSTSGTTNGATTGSTASASETADGGTADTSGTAGGVMGPEIYGLTSYNQVRSCTTNSALKTITCDVDREFIAYLSYNMGLLMEDAATMSMTTSGTSGWKFETCDSTSLMYALGFRTNDLIFEVEGMSVADYEDAVEVWGQLGTTAYSGAGARAKFYRGSVNWTFTANRVNNAKYP